MIHQGYVYGRQRHSFQVCFGAPYYPTIWKVFPYLDTVPGPELLRGKVFRSPIAKTFERDVSDHTSEDDLFTLLGITVASTDEEVKQAYRSQSKIWHPDRCKIAKITEHAGKMFIWIKNAYEICMSQQGRELWEERMQRMRGRLSICKYVVAMNDPDYSRKSPFTAPYGRCHSIPFSRNLAPHGKFRTRSSSSS